MVVLESFCASLAMTVASGNDTTTKSNDEVSLRWACCGQAAEAWPCWDQLEGIDIDSLTVPMEKQDACDSLTVLEDEKAGSA